MILYLWILHVFCDMSFLAKDDVGQRTMSIAQSKVRSNYHSFSVPCFFLSIILSSVRFISLFWCADADRLYRSVRRFVRQIDKPAGAPIGLIVWAYLALFLLNAGLKVPPIVISFFQSCSPIVIHSLNHTHAQERSLPPCHKTKALVLWLPQSRAGG